MRRAVVLLALAALGCAQIVGIERKEPPDGAGDAAADGSRAGPSGPIDAGE